MCTRREAVKLTCWPSAGDFGGTVGHQPETLGHQPETLVGLLAPCWPQTYLGIGHHSARQVPSKALTRYPTMGYPDGLPTQPNPTMGYPDGLPAQPAERTHMPRSILISGQAARLLALAQGSPTYEGAECLKCGGTLRYAAQNRCVTCQRVKYARERNQDVSSLNTYAPRAPDLARHEAIRAHATVYYGKPCQTCGENERDTATGRCRHCRKRKSYKRESPVRIAALQRGESTFIGEPCKRCGGLKKLTLSLHCVDCLEKRTKKKYKSWEHALPTSTNLLRDLSRQLASEAMASGAKTFISATPCQVCGSMERSTARLQCYECQRRKLAKDESSDIQASSEVDLSDIL